MPLPEKQLKLVGVDRYPEPKNFNEAIKFLRAHCRVAQVWMQDADKLKMTCKTSDENEDIAKQEFVIEIPLNEPLEFQQGKIFDTTLKLFAFWRELEEAKGG